MVNIKNTELGIFSEAPIEEKIGVTATDVPDNVTTIASDTFTTSKKPEVHSTNSELTSISLVKNKEGINYAVMQDKGNAYLLPLKGRFFLNYVRAQLSKNGSTPKHHALQDVIEQLDAQASFKGQLIDSWYRVAKLPSGIEIDLGDISHTRVRVTPGRVEIVEAGSANLFYRTPVCLEIARPSLSGDLSLLRKYLNLSPMDQFLLTAWISYTLAHPKIASSKYLILVLQGDQGTGKSSLVSNIILPLIDPSILGMQIFPRNPKDLGIALQNSHLLAYDNMRSFNQSMSDLLCIASTGGAFSSRALYTDSDINVQKLHGALVLNGIHQFVSHSDLAQRCLTIRTQALPEGLRESETKIVSNYAEDFPKIYRGILDLISEVFIHLDEAEVQNPERMIDFVRWLAAMEKVENVPPGTYQAAYSSNLNESQLESLLDHSLANAVFTFATKEIGESWSGTPMDLLNLLNDSAPRETRHSRNWPRNPISLSKKLNALKASFHTQGIQIEFHRSKERKITITNLEAY